jgi:SPP1 gp7 family putative phage head morphogenesis protein
VAWKVSDDPDKFEEALEWFRARTPMSARMFYALDAVARDKAFTVSHVAQMDVVQAVLGAIDKAIESGQDLRQFSAEIGDTLKAAWQGSVGNPAHRVETIFRTNTASAFSRGRQLQMDSPVVSAVRPWRLFDDTRDARESDICEAAGGTIVRFDDPWLDAHTPPLHHQCRSNLRALRDEQARRQKGWGKTPPKTTAAEGFGVKPTMGNVLTTRLKPDYAKYDTALAAKAKLKEKKLRPKTLKPTEGSARTQPEFWVKEFEKKYPREVAETMAYGRAAEERGRSLPLDALDEGFAPLQHTADLRAQFQLKKARGLVPKAKTIGDLLDGLDDVIKKSKDDLPRLADATAARETLRAVSALKEHQRTSGNAVPGVTVADNDNPSPRERASRDAIADSALKWLRKSIGAKVTVRPQRIQYTTGRSYYDPQLIEWAKPSSLVHEWGHKLEEDNPAVGRRAKRFLAARTAGKSPKRLAEIYGEKGYEASEVAVEDSFIEAYMGKQYSGPYSEITSMGMELMFTNYGARLLANDPEYFWFILGQMA